MIDSNKSQLTEPLLGDETTQSNQPCYKLLAIIGLVGMVAVSSLAFGETSHHLRPLPLSSIPLTTSEILQQLNETNNTPDSLQITSYSEWGSGVGCSDGKERSSCIAVLNPGNKQIIAATAEASASSGAQVDYNICTSPDTSSCNGYAGHLSIKYTILDGSLTATLTNNAEGTVQLIPNNDNSEVSIEMISTPTLAPVTSPPTASPQPSPQPTSAAPTPQRPSPAPTLKPSWSPSATSAPTPSSNNAIEQSAWYIDWTVWFNGPPFSIPEGVNLINVFVGEFVYDSNNNPTLGGFGNMNLEQLDAFTAYCKEQTPPIDVKVSIGGGGGSYDNTWDLLTEENTQDFAQGMVDFCHAHGLVGVDFDYEEFKSSEQEALVGTLIRQFKELDPNLQASLCTNAGTSWQATEEIILNAAVSTPGKCPIDRFYIMSYYDPISQEETWIIDWANWLKEKYNCESAVVGVGLDDFDAHAYDLEELKEWALSMGYSTAHWAYDPAHPSTKQLKLKRNLRGSLLKN